MNVGSLFAGIGGFDLGFERAGMRTVWFCESEPFCQRVLAKHWPGVPCYDDVRELSGADVEPVDVLCGGFPCQDLSYAGKGAGIEGANSGLWTEYARIIGEIRPRYVVVENVPALFRRGFGRVLGDLAALGYDAEWDCLPASAFGAPHRRDRVWLVAYPSGTGLEGHGCAGGAASQVPNAGSSGSTQLLAEPESIGRTRTGGTRTGRAGFTDGGGWPAEPSVGRVVDGFPGRVDQVRALGNACLPQIAEWLGQRLMAYERKVAA